MNDKEKHLSDMVKFSKLEGLADVAGRTANIIDHEAGWLSDDERRKELRNGNYSEF